MEQYNLFQVSVLSEQVNAQKEKIRDLETLLLKQPKCHHSEDGVQVREVPMVS